MPETIMPILTGLFLVLAGMLIGYFLWYRDRTQDDALQSQLQQDNEDLLASLKQYKIEHSSLINDLSSQKGKLHILQELCDDLAAGREQFQLDRVALEADICSSRKRLEETQIQLDEEKHQRMTTEDQLHQEQQRNLEQLGQVDNEWRQKHKRLETDLLHRTTDVKQLTVENERAAEKLHAAEAQIAELQSELATLNSLLLTARQNENGLEKEYVSLESSLRSHSELLKESRGQCAAALSAKKLAEESLRDARNQLEDQQLLLSKIEETTAASEAVKLRCVSLEQSLENSQDRLHQLTAQRDSSLLAQKELNETISALRTRLENQEQTIRQLREKSDDFAIQMRDERDSRLEIEASAKDVKHQMQSEIHEIRTEIEQLERERGELTSRIQEMENASEQATSQLEQRTAEIAKANRACDQLATQIATMEQSQMRAASRLEERAAEIAQLTSERDQLASGLTRLQQNHSESTTRLKERSLELEKIKSKRDELSSELESFRSENASLALERDELRQQLNSLKENYSRGSSLLEQRVMEIDALRQERNELSARLLQAELHTSQSDEMSRYQNEEIKTRVNALIVQRDQAFSDLQNQRKEIEALRAEINTLSQDQSQAVILQFGEQVDSEYGGRTRRDAKRGVVYDEAPNSPDDLKLISGIAEVLEKRLNEYGIYTFKQIMHWEDKTVQEFSTLLAFKDRIDRDDWIGQAARFYFAKRRKAA